MEPVIELDGVRVFHGDCRDVLAGLPDNSVDSIVTDPPYELGFMGKSWDTSGIAYNPDVWEQCLRVLKPGGHLLAFGGTRTWHRLAVAVEDAGFEVRDSIAWMYGSGFPKSLDVSKAIDKSNGKHEVDLSPFGAYVKELRESKGLSRKQLDDVMGTNTAVSWWEGRASGVQLPSKETYERLKIVLGMDGRFDSLIDWAEAEREVIGMKNAGIGTGQSYGKIVGEREKVGTTEVPVTAPSTPEAQKWQGWGTALKPAFEPIVVARKPLSGTVAETVLEWGTGGLNIDGSRIGTGTGESRTISYPDIRGDNYQQGKEAYSERGTVERVVKDQGRWPANVILDEVTAGLLDEQSGITSAGRFPGNSQKAPKFSGRTYNNGSEYAGRVDEQARATDSGGASRFFYVAKASKRDRNEGLDGLPEQVGQRTHDGGEDTRGRPLPANRNTHPTVKPTALMRYLVKLVTPPGGTVLDPFTGSGSTGKAALLEGFDFVGVELTDDYLPIIEGRLKWALDNQDEGTLF